MKRRWRIMAPAGALIGALAWAEVNTGWIPQAGGSVTCEGGKTVAVDLRASWITDSDMPRLAQMPDLKRLDLSLTRISDRGLRALKTAPAIEELNLYFAEQISDESMAIVKGWKQLRVLDVKDSGLSEQGVLRLRAALPDCQVLY